MRVLKVVNCCYCCYCIATAVVKYAISTSKESAGGPVFKEDQNQLKLVAIHNGSATKENYGVRLSEILKHWTAKRETGASSTKPTSPTQQLILSQYFSLA